MGANGLAIQLQKVLSKQLIFSIFLKGGGHGKNYSEVYCINI